MDEDMEMWGGEPMNDDIDWDNIKWDEINVAPIELKYSIELKDLLAKYQLTVDGMNVSVDINKLILLGIIKPE